MSSRRISFSATTGNNSLDELEVFIHPDVEGLEPDQMTSKWNGNAYNFRFGLKSNIRSFN
jgi:hypothetical protein